MANRGLRDPDLPTWLTEMGPVATELLDAGQRALDAARRQLTSPEAKQAGDDLFRTLSASVRELGKLVTVPREEPAPERPLVHHGWSTGQRVVLVHRGSNKAHPGLVISTMDTEVRVQPDDGQHPFRLDFDPTTGDFSGMYDVRTPELHQQYLDVEAEATGDPAPGQAGPGVRDLTDTEFLDTLPPCTSGVYRWWTDAGYVVGKVHTQWTVGDELRMLWVEEDDGTIVSLFLRAVTRIEPVE